MDEKLKKKKDEEASQIWIGIGPSAVQCRKCFNALEDTEFTNGAEKAMCKIYTEEKPTEVLWKGADCKYFIAKE